MQREGVQTIVRLGGLLTLVAGAAAMQLEIFPSTVDEYGYPVDDQGSLVRRLAIVCAVVLIVNVVAWNRALLTRTAARLGAVTLAAVGLFLVTTIFIWDLFWEDNLWRFLLETSATLAVVVVANVAAWRTHESGIRMQLKALWRRLFQLEESPKVVQ
jgi:hypothetical protein